MIDDKYDPVLEAQEILKKTQQGTYCISGGTQLVVRKINGITIISSD